MPSLPAVPQTGYPNASQESFYPPAPSHPFLRSSASYKPPPGCARSFSPPLLTACFVQDHGDRGVDSGLMTPRCTLVWSLTSFQVRITTAYYNRLVCLGQTGHLRAFHSSSNFSYAMLRLSLPLFDQIIGATTLFAICLSNFWLCASHIIISRGPMSPQPREDRMNLGIAPVCAAFSSSLFVGRILPVNPIFHTLTSTQTPPKAGPARTTQSPIFPWTFYFQRACPGHLLVESSKNHGHGWYATIASCKRASTSSSDFAWANGRDRPHTPIADIVPY